MPNNDAAGSVTSFAQAATPSTLAPTNIPNGPGIASMTTEQMENTVQPPTPWTTTQAAQITMGDFKKAEAYRNINHDWRFRVSDQMYLAWKERRTWEGTKIPRSSLGIFLALEQIEALLPNVVAALFPENNQMAFDAEPNPGTTIQQAQATRDLIASQLRDLGRPGHYTTMRELARQAYKNSYIYGNGLLEFGVLDQTFPHIRYDRIPVPIRQMTQHPITGEMFAAPTGQFTTTVRKTFEMKHVVRPTIQNFDIRDFYWDPNCSSHNVNDGGYCATRHFLTVNQLLEYSNAEGFSIPNPKDLIALARIKTTTQSDTTKSNQESFRGMTWQPAIDYSVDSGLARVEVIRYWQAHRHVWILGRQWVARNEINPYGMLPFLNAFYVDVPGRFAGLSICDLVEGDQKLAEAIINARIDELNLLIHPPIIKKQGRAFSASQQRLRPGVIWETEDPKNDYVRFEMGNVTQQAFQEIGALEQRVQKKTGVTDLAVLGTPSAGGNSANRTATGVSSQGAAAGKRIQYHVENAEDQFLVPALNILLALNQMFLPQQDLIDVLGPESQQITIDPVDILNASVRFKMNASAKMQSKNALASGGLGLVLQTYLNPEVVNMAAQQGMMIDLPQTVKLVNDVFGLPPTALWKPMSPEDQQKWQQQQMAQIQAKAQMQNDRLQAQQGIAEEKNETQLLKTLLDKLVTNEAAHSMINELTGDTLPKGDEQPTAGAP